MVEFGDLAQTSCEMRNNTDVWCTIYRHEIDLRDIRKQSNRCNSILSMRPASSMVTAMNPLIWWPRLQTPISSLQTIVFALLAKHILVAYNIDWYRPLKHNILPRRSMIGSRAIWEIPRIFFDSYRWNFLTATIRLWFGGISLVHSYYI